MPESTFHRARELKPEYRLMHFVIQRSLGQGECGITYKARDTSRNRDVAIKEYFPGAIALRQNDLSVEPLTSEHMRGYEWGLNRFQKKAKVLTKVKHANIVQVHDVFEKNKTAYMVMEYEGGDNLIEFLAMAGKPDQSLQKQVFFPILTGLARIHKLGFIHGDIKPSNIKIRRNGTAVLINFGFVTKKSLYDSQAAAGILTHSYAPIEQFSADSKQLGPCTDIYSLAATMYYSITGSEPEHSRTRIERRIRGQKDTVIGQLTRGVSATFDTGFLHAVEQGMSLNPKQRPRTIGVWLSSLKNHDSGYPDDNARRSAPILTNQNENNHAFSNEPKASINSAGTKQVGSGRKLHHQSAMPGTLPVRDRSNGKVMNASEVKQISNRRRLSKVILIGIIILFVFAWVSESNLFNARDPDQADVSVPYRKPSSTVGELQEESSAPHIKAAD